MCRLTSSTGVLTPRRAVPFWDGGNTRWWQHWRHYSVMGPSPRTSAAPKATGRSKHPKPLTCNGLLAAVRGVPRQQGRDPGGAQMHGSAAINPGEAVHCSSSNWNNWTSVARVGWSATRPSKCKVLPFPAARTVSLFDAPSHAASGGIHFAKGQSNTSPSTPEVVRP